MLLPLIGFHARSPAASSTSPASSRIRNGADCQSPFATIKLLATAAEDRFTLLTNDTRAEKPTT